MIRKTPRVINSILPRKETRLYEYPLTEMDSSDILVDFLHGHSYITDDDFKIIKQSSLDNNISLIEAMKKEMKLTDEAIAIMLANLYGMDTFDFDSFTISQETISCVPRDVATSLKIMPIYKNGDILTIAISDPSDMNLLDGVNKLLGSVDIVLTTKKQIDDSLLKYYS